MKPIDKAIFGMVSDSSGRNDSERTGRLENRKLQNLREKCGASLVVSVWECLSSQTVSPAELFMP
jgi:hypothetical protein